MSKKVCLFPLWVRIWHWLNALLCLLLMITGISMEFSNPKLLLVDFNLSVTIHNVSAIILTLNYIFYFFGNIITPNARFYKIGFKTFFVDLWKQARFYVYGIFKKEKHPFPITENRKFNPLQLVSYVTIMYIVVPLIVISGWALLFPDTILPTFLGFNGISFTVVIHAILGYIVTIFMFVHIYMSTLGETFLSDFKSMFTGRKEVEE